MFNNTLKLDSCNNAVVLHPNCYLVNGCNRVNVSTTVDFSNGRVVTTLNASYPHEIVDLGLGRVVFINGHEYIEAL